MGKSHCRNSRRAPAAWVALWLALSQPAWAQGEAATPVITVSVEGVFEEVFDTLNTVITGRGINIAHTLGASDMLNRTGPDFGYAEPVYANARIVEFCSARISHLLARADPANIVLCPFTVGIYELASDPGRVYLSYRRPYAGADPDTQAAADQVVELLDGILKEATAW